MLESFIMLRHAEAESNFGKYFAGWSDTSLTDFGRQQAALLSKRLAHEKFGKVFCSDLSRARETLKLSGVKAPTVFSPALREKNYGTLEGINWENQPKYYDDHLDPYKRAPGGESAQEVQKRIVDYFENTIQNSGARHALIVSHHGPLVLLTCHILGISLDGWRGLRLGNAGLGRFDFEQGRFRLTLWNSLSHLGMKTNKKLM